MCGMSEPGNVSTGGVTRVALARAHSNRAMTGTGTRSGAYSSSCSGQHLETDSKMLDRSTTGIVNMYDASSRGTYAQGGERKARKAIENLVTPVTTMRFNHDSQLVALASKTSKDQLKLVRI